MAHPYVPNDERATRAVSVAGRIRDARIRQREDDAICTVIVILRNRGKDALANELCKVRCEEPAR